MAKQKDDKGIQNEIAAQQELNKEISKSKDLVKGILNSEQQSLKTYADRLDLTSQLNENAKVLSTLNISIDKLSASQSDRAKLLTEQYTIHRDLLSDVQTKYIDAIANSNNIADNQFKIVDLSEENAKLIETMVDLEEKRSILKDGEYNKEKQLLDSIKEKINLTNTINASQERANDLAMKFLDTNKLIGHTNQKLISGIESVISSVGSGGLGIIGSFLGNKAQSLLDKTGESIQEKVVKAFQESGNSAVSAFSIARMSLGSFISYALPALGIAGLLGAFALLVKTLSHLDAELSEIGKEFGISRKEADKLHHVTIDIANEMGLVGIRSTQVMEAVKEASSALGGLDILSRFKAGSEGTKQLVKDFAVLKSEFGFEGGELENIQNFALATGKSIGQVVQETVKLGKGLFTSKQAIGVIAKISPSIALSFRRGSQELIKAAQKAKLLGIELSDVQSFGDNILDIETSIQAEMQARALTGKNINLDTARYYALTNNVAGLQEEILKNLGSSVEFGKMNRIQQKSLADAFGMQIEDVAKLLLAQEKLLELGISQNKIDEIQQMNAEQLAAEMKTTTNEKLRGYLETLKREKESASINERLSNVMTMIKEKIAATVSPLLEMAHSFFDSAEGAEFLDKVIKGVKDLILVMIPVVKFLADNIWLVVAALSAIVAAKIVGGIGSIIGGFRSMSGAMQQTAEAAKALGNSSGGISNATGALGGFTSFAQNAVATGIALIAFAGAVFILSKAFQEFSKVSWPDMWKGAVAMALLAGAAWVLAASVKGMAIAAAGVGLLALALLSFGAAVLMIGAGAKLFADSIGSFADGIKKIKNLGDISSVGKTLKEVFSAMSSAVSSIGNPNEYSKIRIALNNLGIDKIIEFSKLTKTDLGKAGDNIVDGINSLSKISFDKNVDFGKASGWSLKGFMGIPILLKEAGTGVIGAFEQLNEALGEIKLDNIEVLAKVASTDMSKLGPNLQKAIQSLEKINIATAIGTLEKVGDVFDELYDAFTGSNLMDTNLLGPLEPLMNLDIDKLKNITYGLKAVIYNLSEIGKMGAPGLESLKTIFENLSSSLNTLDITKLTDLSNVNLDNLKIGKMGAPGLESLKTIFENLSSSLNTLDITKLTDLSNVNLDNLRKLSSVFQQPISTTNVGEQVGKVITTQNNVGAQETMASSNTGTVITNKKLDEAIGILRQILSTSNQPVYIKVGDRTIEAIGSRIGRQNEYKLGSDNTYSKG